jgi:DNA-binding response OmpR family regulator
LPQTSDEGSDPLSLEIEFSHDLHEFRTPLTLMLNPVEALLAASPSDAPEHAMLDVAHRNALRLLKLVNELLDFSRIEAGRIQARYEATDLALLTSEIGSAFRSVIEQAGLKFEVDASPLPEPVFVDRDMWEKVVLNLVSNAFKFTFTGQIGVGVSASADGKAAVVTVHDTGTGISEDELPRVFERFHQIPGARGRSIEGSGIGLALVKELVGLHGGAIAVQSMPGRGTCFTVTVPFGTAHLPSDQVHGDATMTAPARIQSFVSEARRWLPDASRTEPAQLPKPRVAHQQGRVLLADDNADMRGYVERLLREAGLTVQTVADGSAALEAVRATPPDLVLSDVMMPGLDGFALLSALRAEQATRDLPVILLSARAGEEARVEALQAGADDYLVKPFSARELVASVAGAVRLSHLRRATERRNEGQRRILELIASGTPLERTLDEIATYIEAQEPEAIVSILLVDREGKRFLRSRGPSLPDVFHATIDGLSIEPPFTGYCPEALDRCDAISVCDVAADSLYAPFWRELLLSHGLRSVRAIPVIAASGRAEASLAIYYLTPRDPLPANPGIIDIGTNLISIALERAQSERELTENAALLEHLNAELEKRAADALAERKLFADIVEGTDAFVQVVDLDFRWLAINKAAADEFETVFGARPKVGTSMLEILTRVQTHLAHHTMAATRYTEEAKFTASLS